MYAVTPQAEAAWRSLLDHVAAAAQVSFDYLPYPAPQPLDHLWRRPDLGCVLMCGYPIALRLAEVVPIAAPIPNADWADGRPLYRSDLIVRADSPYARLEDTFGGRLGWTVEHSHSGFNALRHHLLAFRTPERPTLYGEVVGPLVTARAVLDAVIEGRIDVGPLDAYWHLMIQRHRPELLAQIRVIDSTALAPIPAFVTGPATPLAEVTRLARAFAEAAGAPWFPPLAAILCLKGFAVVERRDFTPTLTWARAADSAGYPMPG
jgi:ABC-type phosphate/phosphonate transport system substrate-binding protein